MSSKKHDAIFDDVLSDLDVGTSQEPQTGARFLKRSTTIGERLSGELEEKTLRWVDPARCRMWDRHNRDYALLTQDNCRDLIDGIRAQGRQEFPAIVRPVSGDPDYEYEVICGARRHFAVSWLREQNYTQFKYLVEPRELSDEEAFRLADIENRDREDISDYERAIDYADAVARYYGGKQKAMAERLEVSQPWLSRYLQLAKLPRKIVEAFATVRDIRERNARELKPLLADPVSAKEVMDEATILGGEQASARLGFGTFVDSQTVMRRLVKAGKPSKVKETGDAQTYTGDSAQRGISVRETSRKVVVEFDASLSRAELETAFQDFLARRFNQH